MTGRSPEGSGSRPTGRAEDVAAVPASIPSAVQIILANLNQDQRNFILKMKPHSREQRINEADWKLVDPGVQLEPVAYNWSHTYWFGSMRATWPVKRCRRTFQFNADGLAVRAILASGTEARRAEPGTGSVHDGPVRDSADAQPQSGSPQ